MEENKETKLDAVRQRGEECLCFWKCDSDEKTQEEETKLVGRNKRAQGCAIHIFWKSLEIE